MPPYPCIAALDLQEVGLVLLLKASSLSPYSVSPYSLDLQEVGLVLLLKAISLGLRIIGAGSPFVTVRGVESGLALSHNIMESEFIRDMQSRVRLGVGSRASRCCSVWSHPLIPSCP